VGGATAAATAGVPADYTPTVEDVFAVIEEYLKQNPELAPKVGTTYLWKIGSHVWTLDLKTGAGSVAAGGTTADCTLELAEQDFLALTQGKADAMKLFTTGKLKISGNVMASQKLQFLSKLDPAKAVEVVAKRRGTGAAAAAGTGAGTAATGAQPAAEAKAPKILEALRQRLAENPGLVQEVRATVSLQVREPDLSQTLELGGADPAKVDATLTISDADLAALASGQTTAQKLYQHGKLRIDGDVSVAHRLGLFKGLIQH
jgi:3-hydroxyacyl-CoA dehydrogenase/3a,7a,12a-trihydroxy-5b-cholest-24-enoyl-CoA hydratase